VDPAPPPITIVDPNAPLGTTELLGSDREPGRVSPYQKLVVAMTALIVALVSIGVARIKQVHHGQQLDAAAVAAVSLAVQPSADYYGEDSGKILIVNNGPQRVVIESAQFVGQGFQPQRQSVRIESTLANGIEVSEAKNCTPALYQGGPRQLRVTARTVRGGLAQRTLELPPDVTQRAGGMQRARCGYLLPAEALWPQLTGARRVGDDVVATFELQNEGVLPLTVSGLQAPEGMTFRAQLPVTLGPRQFWTGHSRPVTLTVRLHVQDCGLFRQAGADGIGPVGVLAVTLANRYVSGASELQLSGFQVVAEPGQNQAPDALTLLNDICPPDYEGPVVPG
jgi:hypothetical protein